MNFMISAMPLVVGFLLDALIGDPYSLPHPIRLIGRLISALERLVRAHFKDLAGNTVRTAFFLLFSEYLAWRRGRERALLLYARGKEPVRREHEGVSRA